MKVFHLTNRSALRPFVLALLGLFLSLSTALAADRPQNLYMDWVGETYSRGGQKQIPLPCCEKDARDMAKWAEGQKGKLFVNTHVRSMIDADARAADILTALRGLKDRVQHGDYAIVYMSGH